MDKRKLAKLPVETIDTEILKKYQNEKYAVTASLIERKTILVLHFYKVASASNKEVFRTFLSKKDYITQDLSTTKTKWRTSSFEGMTDIFFYNYRESRMIAPVFASSKDEELVRKFFESYKTEKISTWRMIIHFQREVMLERLHKKDQKVFDRVDKKMKTVKKTSKRFVYWVWKDGMSFSRYGIYKQISNKETVLQCTHCGKKEIIDRKKIGLKNNQKGKCPFCKSPVVFKARGRMPRVKIDECNFLYVESQEKGFLLRYFHATRRILTSKTETKSLINESLKEYARCFWQFEETGAPVIETYEYGRYKNRGYYRWIPFQGIYFFNAKLYPKNLPDAWKHTPMKYSALEILSRDLPSVPLFYENIMRAFLDFPKLEWFIKMKFHNLIIGIFQNNFYRSYYYSFLNFNGNTIYEILGLNKINTKLLQSMNGNLNELKLLKTSQKMGLRITPQQLRDFYHRFGCNTKLLECKKDYVSLHKFMKYFEKESEEYPQSEARYSHETKESRMAYDWKTYLTWCEKLGYNLDNPFYYMPNHFLRVHDRVAKEYEEFQNKKAAAEKKRIWQLCEQKNKEMRNKMLKVFSNEKTLNNPNVFSIKGNELILVVPKNGDEIQKEGENLHHCVRTYIKQIAKGETNVFFIRKKNNPEKSYYTMEWKDNQVKQCRGDHNSSMTEDVQSFVHAFETKMLKTQVIS